MLDPRVAEVAQRRHGVFTRHEALELGASEGAIRVRVASGRWVCLEPGLFALAGTPLGWEQALTAALLSRLGSLACRRSAAHLHGLPGFIPPSRPEIVIPYGGNARSRLATIRRSVYFDLLGRCTVDGFPTTDVAETLFMLAGVVDEARVGRLVSHVLTQRKATFDDLAEVHVRHLGDRIPGVRRFERALAVHDPRGRAAPESELEVLLHRLASHPEVPEWVPQHPLPWSPQGHRVDIYIPAWTLILEGDGRPWHTRVDDFERDRERDNLAASHGLGVLRFTWKMLTKDFARCQQLLLETGRRRPHQR